MALSHDAQHAIRELRDWDWRATARDLLDHAPSTEELRRLAHVPRWRARSGPDAFALAGIFVAGLIAGAGLALLFAPKPGQELRSQLRRQAGFEDTPRRRAAGDGPSGTTASAIPQR
jgi:hypothetical protein